jgi:hypothetical protein
VIKYGLNFYRIIAEDPLNAPVEFPEQAVPGGDKPGADALSCGLV